MRYRFIPILLFLIIVSPLLYNIITSVDNNYQLPNIKTIPSSVILLNSIIDDKQLQLPKDSEYILHIFSSWCPYCIKEERLIKELAKTIKIYGLVWRDSKAEILEWLSKRDNYYQDIAILNSHAIVDLGINMMPTTLYIGKNNTVLYYNRGSINKEFLNAIQ